MPKLEKQILKVGIAGYGVVGKRRREFIDRNPYLKTVAVCDRRFNKSGVFSDEVRYFSNYRQLLREPLDVLFVSLPNYLASKVTVAGLEQGLHVFCEKPPGQSVEDVGRIIRAEKKHPKLLLKFGFNHRYHDSVREALRIINSGKLGKVVNMRGVYGKSKIVSFSSGWRAQRRYAGGGILLDQGIHMVDLMRLFCGDFVEVKSYISNNYWKHDVEDNAYALMKDRQGRIAILHSSATQWAHRFSLELTLTEGYLELQGILSGSKSYGEERLIIGRRNKSDNGTAQEKIITYHEDNSWRDEINEFADAIVYKKPIQFGTSYDALATMNLVYQIYYADPEWRRAIRIKKPD